VSYIQRKDGEGFVVPAKKVYRIACCDCGLVHDFVFVNGRGVVGIAARRNRRATAARRRQMKTKKIVQK
jgi:hypothetical protein